MLLPSVGSIDPVPGPVYPGTLASAGAACRRDSRDLLVPCAHACKALCSLRASSRRAARGGPAVGWPDRPRGLVRCGCRAYRGPYAAQTVRAARSARPLLPAVARSATHAGNNGGSVHKAPGAGRQAESGNCRRIGHGKAHFNFSCSHFNTLPLMPRPILTESYFDACLHCFLHHCFLLCKMVAGHLKMVAGHLAASPTNCPTDSFVFELSSTIAEIVCSSSASISLQPNSVVRPARQIQFQIDFTL